MGRVNLFAAKALLSPPLLPPGAPPPPTAPPPRNLPDVRSMLFHFRYSISELPPGGYRAQLVDDRVGRLFPQVQALTSARVFHSSRAYIARGGLEQRDPAPAPSRQTH